MKIRIGPSVEGDDFFGRERELRNLADIMSDRSASVLIPGPRRIGKSSLIIEFIRRKKAEYNFIYFDLEGRQSVMELCQDLLVEVQKSYPEYASKWPAWSKSWNTVAKMIPELKVSGLIEFKTGKITAEAKEVIDKMEIIFDTLVDQNFIFVFDEFSDFLWKLKGKSIHEVQFFLEWLRRLRQHKKLRLIVSGSINIISTVEELYVADLINDLVDLEIFPLKEAEIKTFLLALLEDVKISLSDDALDFAMTRLSDGIPFFIQLFASSLRFHREGGETSYDLTETKEIYAKITARQHKEYIDLHSRLKDYLTTDQHQAALKALAHLASDPMNFEDLWPYVESHLTEKADFHRLLKRLADENYIVQGKQEYRFVSPMLADWWRHSYEWEK
ncbi:MAG: ATP-binding protein [Deltaproteobacteria bacterium]|nr:ATP-binding protein [Deltaproteobacteria bacterium]